MTDRNDFDTGPDRALGELLRSHLIAPDDAGFAVRVMERVRLTPRDSSWDVLARWTPRGLAVAAVMLLAVGLGFAAATSRENATPDAQSIATGSPTEILTVPEPLNDEQILTVVLEGGGRQDQGERQ